MEHPLLLSPRAAGKLVGIGRDCAKAKVDSGEWPHELIGKRKKVPIAFLKMRYGDKFTQQESST